MVPFDESSILSAVADRRATDLRFRQRQLHSLHKWVGQYAIELEHAICDDDDFQEAEGQLIVAFALGELRNNYNSLDLEQQLAAEYKVKKNHDNENRRVAEELVYLIPGEFTPFFSVLSVLCACITAGSCCVIELPPTLRRLPSLLRKMINDALDKLAFGFANDRPGLDFLKKCLVVDQGNAAPPTIFGRLLHTGPHCLAVAIVDRTADVKLAAKAIAMSVTWFSGRGPYVPACVLVNEFVEEEFLRQFKAYAFPERQNVSHNGDVSPVFQKSSRHQSIHQQVSLPVKKLQLTQNSDRRHLNLERRSEATVPMLLATTSLDDAIDLLDSKASDSLLALYIFAEPKPAQYLGQFVRATVEFINHIPADILGVQSHLSNRREMFETSSPQFVRPVPESIGIHELELNTSNRSTHILTKVLPPLKASGQAREGDVNFFVQGMRMAIAVYIVPGLVATAGILLLSAKLLCRKPQT